MVTRGGAEELVTEPSEFLDLLDESSCAVPYAEVVEVVVPHGNASDLVLVVLETVSE